MFTWFAGCRFFAAQGLAGDISDVWSGMSGLSEAMKAASTGEDGKQYFVPLTTYPWGLFYRKSVWQEKGYEEPKTLDELVALAKQMQGDGLIPIAFADKDGWPAMGTFDQLDLRINGYQFHIDLMAGKQAWDSPQVKKVFDTWRSCCPTTRRTPWGASGRRRPGPAEEGGGDVPARHVRGRAVPRRRTGRTSTSSPSPRSTRPSAPAPSRRPSTAS